MLTHKKCKLYLKTVKDISLTAVKKKLFDFIQLKTASPQSKFGSSDYAFVNKGALGGYYHAHLSSDISIVYVIKNNSLYTYGIFTHDELGTGQPANINKQKSMKQKFDNQIFEANLTAQIQREYGMSPKELFESQEWVEMPVEDYIVELEAQIAELEAKENTKH